MDDEKFQKVKMDIKKINTPETLKRNLINASLILAAYELMKYSLIERVKNFCNNDGTWNLEELNEHKNEIERLRNKLHKKRRGDDLLAYVFWFQKYEALTEIDVKNIKKIRRYRNDVTHELIKFLTDSAFEVNVIYLFEIRDIIEKIDIWWMKEVESPINPDIDQDKIKNAVIKSGRMIILDHLISTAMELPSLEEEDKSGLVH